MDSGNRIDRWNFIIYGIRPDAKALIKDVSVDKELMFRYQIRLATVVVYTINYAVLGYCFFINDCGIYV